MNFLWINHCSGTSLIIGITIKILVLLITYVIPAVLVIYGIYKHKKDKKKKDKTDKIPYPKRRVLKIWKNMKKKKIELKE